MLSKSRHNKSCSKSKVLRKVQSKSYDTNKNLNNEEDFLKTSRSIVEGLFVVIFQNNIDLSLKLRKNKILANINTTVSSIDNF